MVSPSLKDSSAGFSASKSKMAMHEGCAAFVGVVAGDGLRANLINHLGPYFKGFLS
jgi:hypothetical protein